MKVLSSSLEARVDLRQQDHEVTALSGNAAMLRPDLSEGKKFVSTNPGHPLIQLVPAASAGAPVVAGQTIGKYRIIRDVGVGGMAQVFLASRQGPEGFAKPYVIKRILPQYSRDEQFSRMFVTEAKVAALLDHPNIVHVFDFEFENGDYYLVMEYVAGASLAQVLRANRRKGVPLGAQIAVEIGVAVAHALAYAHDLTLPDGTPLDLVHRDISPGNVLISRDGAVKLADFGVVKTSMTATVVGVVNGKWAYMSPEQISGQAGGPAVGPLFPGNRVVRDHHGEAFVSRRKRGGHGVAGHGVGGSPSISQSCPIWIRAWTTS